MIVPRKPFLASTTAYTSVNLFTRRASSGLGNFSRPRWHSVWFQPSDRTEAKIPGIENYTLPAWRPNLDARDRWMIKNAYVGGKQPVQTTHIVYDDAP